LHASAVGRDPGVRVHLSIELRDQHKRNARADRFDDARARPHMAPAVELIPRALSPEPDLLEGHRWMGCVEPWPAIFMNEPMLRDRHTVHERAATSLIDRPLLEVQSTRERREQDELRERQIRSLRERDRRVEAVLRIARETKNERAEDVNPAAAKGT